MDKRTHGTIPKTVIDAICKGFFTHIETRILMALYTYNNHKTEEPVFPSRSTLHRQTGVSIPNISKATKSLEKKKVLVKLHEKGKSVRYYLRQQWEGVPIEATPKTASPLRPEGVPESDTGSGESLVVSESDRGVVSESDTLTYQEHRASPKTASLWRGGFASAGEKAWMRGA